MSGKCFPFLFLKTLSFPFSFTEINHSFSLTTEKIRVAVKSSFLISHCWNKESSSSSGNYFPRIFLLLSIFFFPCSILWLWNLVSLLILGKKSEQCHALFCIGSQILLVCCVCLIISDQSLTFPIATFLFHHTSSFFLGIGFWVLVWEERVLLYIHALDLPSRRGQIKAKIDERHL